MRFWRRPSRPCQRLLFLRPPQSPPRWPLFPALSEHAAFMASVGQEPPRPLSSCIKPDYNGHACSLWAPLILSATAPASQTFPNPQHQSSTFLKPCSSEGHPEPTATGQGSCPSRRCRPPEPFTLKPKSLSTCGCPFPCDSEIRARPILLMI